MGLKILEEIEVAQVGVWMNGLLVLIASLESLNLVVNEKARGNLPPAVYDFEDGVEGDAGER